MFKAFERGADDVVPYAAQPGELAARMRARLDRRAVSRADLLRDPATGALTEESFALLLQRESERARLARWKSLLRGGSRVEAVDVLAAIHDLTRGSGAPLLFGI